MEWTDRHARILGQAFTKVLGRPESGSMAFVRCLLPEVVHDLAGDTSFAPQGWQVLCVAHEDNGDARTITADRAVEMRETKKGATLLLVDTDRAGAGMDGIYSAAREVDEESLFKEALNAAKSEVTTHLSRADRGYAERAVRKARDRGRYSVSSWTEFDFFCRIAADRRHPGAYLHLLGLWPVQTEDEIAVAEELNVSRMFVERLLGTQVARLTPAKRIESLRLQPGEQQRRDLERFLRRSDTQPLLPALAELAEQKHLWVNALPLEDAAQEIQSIELSPWRTKTDKIAKWSGLYERDDHDPHDPPELILKPDVEQASDYSNLEVKWKARPANLAEGAAEYQVAITTDMGEELATRDVVHSAKREEKCRFNNDDFTDLSEDALIPAKVVVSVLGDTQKKIEPVESEEFIIRFGDPPNIQQGGGGRTVRTFSEGLIELESREMVSELISETISSRRPLPVDAKGYVRLRTPQRKTLRVFQPPLLKEVEKQWALSKGAIGRWVVKVRASGDRSGAVEFVPIAMSTPADEGERVKEASRKMAARFAMSGGVGQVYDEKADFKSVREYLLAWAALLEKGDPSLALANTVEVQSLSGRTIGLIVLPSHPLRVAWHVAYDNLVFHAKFEQGMTPKEIREELSSLDGAMFPAFLPGLEPGTSFVFADTLGFHALGMVRDCDKEPKAALAILARTIGAGETADAAPTVGEQSAAVLGTEIVKYLESHTTEKRTSKLLHIHALRAGDGLTMARALGRVHKHYRSIADEEDLEEDPQETAPAFVLELYPSAEQRGIAGQFIVGAREKRRRGAGVLAPADQWMLESLRRPGGVSLPRLQWARKSEQDPRTAAHLAIAFDTFASQVMATDPPQTSRPLYAFGLLSFFERAYDANSSFPLWHSIIPPTKEGEKHPADKSHTDRLTRLQDAIQRAVARHMEAEGKLPTLRTEISADKEKSLDKLHRLCDWVITLDRNAGIEYFDSPQDKKHIYDAYVIDCVPEREDLGCLQLITSTSNLEDMQALLDDVLKQMGIARSGRNAAFLLQHLKALSGQLTLRLTGSKAATAQLVALSASYANCRQPSASSDCWLSLERGFLIPVEEVRGLLPPVGNEDENEAQPDLLYVSRVPRKGLRFQFIKVKYRRHLRAARGPEVLQGIDKQVRSLRKEWARWYEHEDVCSSFRAVRRAKLARVLRFYTDKAHRHGLPKEEHEAILSEIERMVGKGGDYPFVEIAEGDRGWIFCPEYAGYDPLEISPDGWNTRIFLFGPGLLPDADVYPESIACSSAGGSSSSGRSGQEAQNGTGPVAKTAAKEPSICLGKDTLTGGEVHWPLTTKGNPHLLVAGLPGMGKTTCLLNLCQQMVAAGVRPIVFSYHEDIDERLEQLVESVRFIDFQGLGFNPLQVIDRESRIAYLDVAGALRDIFISIFPELGDIQGERIRSAIKESFIEMGWDDPNADVASLHEPEFKRFVEILQDDPKPDRGLRTLLARLSELKDYNFFELQESRASLWESEQPTVIRIHTTQNDNLQKAFASLIFYGLYKDMFRRGVQDRITHAVIFDEAHRAAGLKLIPTMAKECRKYGISLVLASQEARDFHDSLFSAIANYLVLRLTEADAKALVRKVASSQQERAQIDKIKQIDRFKALYFCEGKSRPSVLDLLPLAG